MKKNDHFARGIENLDVRLSSKQLGLIISLLDPKDENNISFQNFDSVLNGQNDLSENSTVESATEQQMTPSVSAPTLSSNKIPC
jgi:hypothetical protein